MNIVSGTTEFNDVADNIGANIISFTGYDEEQVLYNFERFDYAKNDITLYIYPADNARTTLLQDLYKNVVEWHITVVYKEEAKDVVDDTAYDLRSDMLAIIQEVQAAIAADTSIVSTCRVAEIIGMFFEGTQSPGENLSIGRIFLSTVFYTEN